LSPLDGDAALRARAARVVPGGMWGHLDTRRLPAGYPQFFTQAEGGHIWGNCSTPTPQALSGEVHRPA